MSEKSSSKRHTETSEPILKEEYFLKLTFFVFITLQILALSQKYDEQSQSFR